jgi:hypothetical protein
LISGWRRSVLQAVHRVGLLLPMYRREPLMKHI